MYIVKDSTGKFLRSFPTWKLANGFRCSMGRVDWPIVEVKKVKNPLSSLGLIPKNQYYCNMFPQKDR